MIGIDIVSVEKLRSKDTLIKKIFTDYELNYALNKRNPYQSLAGLFALKEAVIKALGLNLSYIIRKRIEIRHSKNKPYVLLDSEKINTSVSISHDEDYSVAICLLTKARDLVSVRKDMKEIMPKRRKDSHKGTYGRFAVLGGSPGMAGSCYLSSTSALRVGAGLVYLIVPRSISTVLEIKCTEQIVNTIDSDQLKYNKDIFKQISIYLDKIDTLAIGPGMGKGAGLNRLISEILISFKGKVIIDADGLNALALDKKVLLKRNDLILTPHLKEFSRLTGLTIDEINQDRLGIAKKFAEKYRLVLVLKSENTIVTDGKNAYINKIGNPGMATAGSGDVLTGVIGGLLHILNPYEASKLGVYLHSLAADLAANDLSEYSLIASDIIKYLAEAIKLLRRK